MFSGVHLALSALKVRLAPWSMPLSTSPVLLLREVKSPVSRRVVLMILLILDPTAHSSHKNAVAAGVRNRQVRPIETGKQP